MCLPSYRIPASVRHGLQRMPKPNLTQHRVILLAIDLGMAACVCLATTFQRLLGMAATGCPNLTLPSIELYVLLLTEAWPHQRLLGMVARGCPNLT